jgi:hypothetical protein
MINRSHIESPIKEENFIYSAQRDIEIGEVVSYQNDLLLVLEKNPRVRNLPNSGALHVYDLLTLRPFTLEADIQIPDYEVERQPLLR